MRSYAASSSNGLPMRLETSMCWPRPPRVRPAPPESDRNSLRQKMSGVMDSAISTGVPFTPEG